MDMEVLQKFLELKFKDVCKALFRVLLVGVSEYPDGGKWDTLDAPPIDVLAMHKMFSKETIVKKKQIKKLIDADNDKIIEELDGLSMAAEFASSNDQQAVIIFYYSGHGITNREDCLLYGIGNNGEFIPLE